MPVLLAPLADNSGAYRGAGETVAIGTDPDQISAEVAQDRIARGLAIADAVEAPKRDDRTR